MAHANDTNTAAAKPVNNQHPHIHALFVGQPKTITDERGTWTSSIYRDPVGGPVLAQPGAWLATRWPNPITAALTPIFVSTCSTTIASGMPTMV